MSRTKRILRSAYTKIAFGAVLGFVGIVSGIYVGSAVVQPEQAVERPGPITGEDHYMDLDERYVSFNIGDAFPLEQLHWPEGQADNFASLLADQKSLVLFLSHECGPCMDLLKFWKRHLTDRVRPDVQTVICLADNRPPLPVEYTGLIETMDVVYYDGSLWSDVYDMNFSPIIIGVDESGIVRHIQFGFDNYIDQELVEYFFKSNT